MSVVCVLDAADIAFAQFMLDRPQETVAVVPGVFDVITAGNVGSPDEIAFVVVVVFVRPVEGNLVVVVDAVISAIVQARRGKQTVAVAVVNVSFVRCTGAGVLDPFKLSSIVVVVLDEQSVERRLDRRNPVGSVVSKIKHFGKCAARRSSVMKDRAKPAMLVIDEF